MSEDLYSDVYDDNYDQEPVQQTGPKALREAYEKEKEARKALEDRLSAIERESQAQKLATALEGKGVNPKAAALAQKAGVTPDKVDEWITEFGDLFGITADSEQEQSGGGVDQETQQQIAAVSGTPTGTAPVTSGDDLAQLNALDNEGDFWAHINAHK